MATPTKPLLNSTTTQNVAVGAAGSISPILGIVMLLRLTETAPWPVDADSAVVAAASAIVLPFASRLTAFVRAWNKSRSKKKRTAKLKGLSPLVFAFLAASLMLGCQTLTTTVTSPDGTITVTEQSDPAQIQMVMQLAEGTIRLIDMQLQRDGTLSEEARAELELKKEIEAQRLDMLLTLLRAADNKETK